MAYIYPSTEIVLCKDVPLDNSYDHTLTFANASAQYIYFSSKAYKSINVNSYQRTMNDKLRIQCTMDEAVRCNYLFFRNVLFENKTFYAFITGWEYINNVTTEITYEIDVFQTFIFDLDIKPSFVEREHSNTDTIGENLVPENLEQGEYILMDSQAVDPNAITGYVAAGGCVIMYCTFNDDTDCTNFEGGFTNYCHTGLNPIIKTTENDLNSFLQKVYDKKGSLDGIITAYMCPFIPLTNVTAYLTWNTSIIKNFTTLNGYTPKNNKLYTSPYYTMRVRSDTDMNEYPYEYFNGNTCEFDLVATIVPEPCLVLIPKNYLRNGNANNHRLDYRMTISNFPQVSFPSDVYKVYMAQNAASIRTSMLGTGVKGVNNVLGSLWSASKSKSVSGFGSALFSAAGSFIDTQFDIMQELAKQKDISIRPPQLNGTQSSLNDYAIAAKKFYIDFLSIRAEFAAIIDEYFNMYGYATHRVKIPNTTGRPHWNYVKTKGIVLDVANAPQPYIQKIIDCFNKGITFWHNPSEVGNYNLDNRPVITP